MILIAPFSSFYNNKFLSLLNKCVRIFWRLNLGKEALEEFLNPAIFWSKFEQVSKEAICCMTQGISFFLFFYDTIFSGDPFFLISSIHKYELYFIHRNVGMLKSLKWKALSVQVFLVITWAASINNVKNA